MTEDQIYQVLVNSSKNVELWKAYSSLFDSSANTDSSGKINVTYMRTMQVHAGPVKDGEKVYTSIRDDPI